MTSTTSAAAVSAVRGCHRIMKSTRTPPLQPLAAAVTTVGQQQHLPPSNTTTTITHHSRRSLSSSSKSTNLRNYLDVWVGSNPSPKQNKNATTPTPKPTRSTPAASTPSTSPSSNAQTNVQHQPVILSGSSYLLPTLRLERNDTAESLALRIGAALDSSSSSSGSTTTTIVRSMLSGKESSCGEQWRVPIILDTAALVPDGSPHYVPPPPLLLTQIWRTLDQQFGIRIVGISNPPPAMEEEAIQTLGLPCVISKSRALDRQKDSKFQIQDVIQLTIQQLQQQQQQQGGGMTKDDIDMAIAVEQQQQQQQQLQQQAEDDAAAGAAAVIEKEVATMEASSTISESGEALEYDESNSHNVDAAYTNEDIQSQKDNSDTAANQEETTTVPSPIPSIPGETKVYRGSVRSGQQVAADKNQSLLIMGQVNPGGEVLADGDIYVFGKLRGRALAGLASNSQNGKARIFASSFDPELVCVGDSFTTIDNVEEELGLRRGEPAMASLNEHGELVFESVSL